MPAEQVSEPDVLYGVEPEVRSSIIALGAVQKPYVKPVVATFALDSDGVHSGDALTANG